MSGRSPQHKKQDQTSLREMFLGIGDRIHFLFSKWKVILTCAIIGLLGGLAIALFSAPKYSATISFVTDSDRQPAGGAFTGLAASFGFNLNNGSGSDLFTGNNIYGLMQTRYMLKNTLLTPVQIEGKKVLLIDRYIQMEDLRKEWEGSANLAGISFDEDTSHLTIYQNRIISFICNSLKKENLQFPDGSDNGSLKSVTLVSKDEKFSALFVTTLIKNVSEYYISTTTKKARNSLNILNKQLDSVREQLYGAMSNAAAFSDKNLNLVRSSPKVEQHKATLKMEVNSAIYKQLVASVEQAKMTLMRETPLFEVVDRPVYPLPIIRHGKILWSLIGLFVGLFIPCGCLLVWYWYKSVMEGKYEK